jgi:hypothetical protein
VILRDRFVRHQDRENVGFAQGRFGKAVHGFGIVKPKAPRVILDGRAAGASGNQYRLMVRTLTPRLRVGGRWGSAGANQVINLGRRSQVVRRAGCRAAAVFGCRLVRAGRRYRLGVVSFASFWRLGLGKCSLHC